MSTYTGLTRISGELPSKSAGIVEDAYRSSFVQRLKDKVQGAGSNISEWYEDLNPEVRNAVIRGGAGALGGAALGGGLNYFHNRARDPEDRTSSLSPALLGALLGGGAAIALPAGLKMLTGQTRFPTERRPSLVSRGVSGVLSPVTAAPLPTAGGLVGAEFTRRNWDIIGQALRDAKFKGGKKILPGLTGKTRMARMGQRLHPSRLKRYGQAGAQAMKTKNMQKAVHAVRGVSKGKGMAKVVSDPKLLHKWTSSGKTGLVAIPLGLALGALGDQYLKGRVN